MDIPARDPLARYPRTKICPRRHIRKLEPEKHSDGKLGLAKYIGGHLFREKRLDIQIQLLKSFKHRPESILWDSHCIAPIDNLVSLLANHKCLLSPAIGISFLFPPRFSEDLSVVHPSPRQSSQAKTAFTLRNEICRNLCFPKHEKICTPGQAHSLDPGSLSTSLCLYCSRLYLANELISRIFLP